MVGYIFVDSSLSVSHGTVSGGRRVICLGTAFTLYWSIFIMDLHSKLLKKKFENNLRDGKKSGRTFLRIAGFGENFSLQCTSRIITTVY